MLKLCDRVLSAFENTVLVVGVLSASFVLFGNVVLRYFFNGGWSWAEEYARYAIIWVTFAGCGVAVRKNAHMRVTALYEVLNPKTKEAMEIMVNVVSLIFAAFLLYVGTRLTLKTLSTGQLSTAMPVPMWIIYISVPIGSALTILRLLQSLYRQLPFGRKEADA